MPGCATLTRTVCLREDRGDKDFMAHRKHIAALRRFRAAVSCAVALVILTVPVTCDAASMPHSIFFDPHHHASTNSSSIAWTSAHGHHLRSPSPQVEDEQGADLASLSHVSGNLFLVSTATIPTVWTLIAADRPATVRIDIELPPVGPATTPEPPPPRTPLRG
jgi:hypothetical protein